MQTLLVTHLLLLLSNTSACSSNYCSFCIEHFQLNLLVTFNTMASKMLTHVAAEAKLRQSRKRGRKPKTVPLDLVESSTEILKTLPESQDVDATVVPSKKQRTPKTHKPRKYLILNSVYSVNWSGTKNIFLGLDISNNFEPLLNLAKTVPGKCMGVYLNYSEFQSFTAHTVVEKIQQYFKNNDTACSNTINVTDDLKITFRTYYANKYVVITKDETDICVEEHEKFYEDCIIFKEESWR